DRVRQAAIDADLDPGGIQRRPGIDRRLTDSIVVESDGRLPGPGPSCLRNHQLILHQQPDLDDRQRHDEDQGEDEGELDSRRASLPLPRLACTLASVHRGAQKLLVKSSMTLSKKAGSLPLDWAQAISTRAAAAAARMTSAYSAVVCPLSSHSRPAAREIRVRRALAPSRIEATIRTFSRSITSPPFLRAVSGAI